MLIYINIQYIIRDWNAIIVLSILKPNFRIFVGYDLVRDKQCNRVRCTHACGSCIYLCTKVFENITSPLHCNRVHMLKNMELKQISLSCKQMFFIHISQSYLNRMISLSDILFLNFSHKDSFELCNN